jgi:DNA-binding transcriptional LysR family regulator
MTAATSSHQIRRLERELGTPLFERTSRRVVPTEAGQVIAGRARTILAELDGARQEVDELCGVLRGHIDRSAPPRRRHRRTRTARSLQPPTRASTSAWPRASLPTCFVATDELDAAFCRWQARFRKSSPLSSSARRRLLPPRSSHRVCSNIPRRREAVDGFCTVGRAMPLRHHENWLPGRPGRAASAPPRQGGS